MAPESLEQMDGVMTAAVTGIVRMDATDEAAQQAAWNVRFGGLGLRPGSLLALPAHMASMVEARPMVEWMAETATRRGIQVMRRIADVMGEAQDVLVGGPKAETLTARLMKSIDVTDEAALERAAQTLGQEVEGARSAGEWSTEGRRTWRRNGGWRSRGDRSRRREEEIAGEAGECD